MICGSYQCPKYNECGRSVRNVEHDTLDQVEDLYNFGSASISYNSSTGKVTTKRRSDCGPCGNYGLFYPKSSTIWDTIKLTKEKIEKDKEEMNDILKVDVEIAQYITSEELPSSIHIRSALEDDFVVIKCGDLAFKVKASELTKAVQCCSNNRW